MKKILLAIVVALLTALAFSCEDYCEAEYRVSKRVEVSKTEMPNTYSTNEVVVITKDSTIVGDLTPFSIIVKDGATLTVDGDVATDGSVIIDNEGTINVSGSLNVKTNIFFKGDPGVYRINVNLGVVAQEANAEVDITAYIYYGLFESIQKIYGLGEVIISYDGTLDDGEDFEGAYRNLGTRNRPCDQPKYSHNKLYKYERIN